MREFVKVASDNGWTTPDHPEYTPGSVIVMSRGAELIEVEIGSGGIPRRVRRFNPITGRDESLRQNYINMKQLLGWLKADEPSES